jgi:myxalamid-type polyketide synthase MxaE and MxaD
MGIEKESSLTTDTSRRLAGLSPEKRQLLEKRLGQAKTERSSPISDSIAIIGMACRFPGGADGPDKFWELLISGQDAIREVPSHRREWFREDYATDEPENAVLRMGGFLDRVDEFDAAFFNISPREAQQMDPQQRLLLLKAWEALESAGQGMAEMAGSNTGVFIGIHSQSSDYYFMQIADSAAVDTYTATGGAHSIFANRISYFLDLKGPSLAVDTACSSSLVALHLACQSLRGRECDMALAGGVNLMLTPDASSAFSKLQFLSPEGRCKTFDVKADGFVRGEGCGVLVLRRYAEAVKRGDPVLALIRGSAVNQDGATNGLTAPNGLSQQTVVRQALKNAGVDPAAITFVETHGTGTVLGDPIEVEALAAVLGSGKASQAACRLGAVKSNIGHLEAAAGIAGVIKTVLCLKHRYIPPNANFTKLNPHIDLSRTRLVIPQEGGSWEATGEGRYGGVSSFGFGGTNAHVILQETPSAGSQEEEKEGGGQRRDILVLPLSARSTESLNAMARKWRGFLEQCKETELPDIAYSAAVRRDHHSHRLALSGRSRQDLIEGLDAYLLGKPYPGAHWGERETAPPALGPVLVYGGQGPQWYAMGRRLLMTEAVFRQTLQHCADLLGEHAGWSLMAELAADESRSRLDQTEIAQPALFALQMGLTALLKSWGVKPGAVVGHSVGEVAAACAAGVLSLDQAVKVVFHRGRLLQGATGKGRMAAVELPLEEAKQLISASGGAVCIAAVNGPASVTLSGDAAALASLLDALADRKVFCRLLNVNYAFHSHQVEPFQEELTQTLDRLTCRPPEMLAVSTVTGRRFREGDFGRDYWAANIRRPVRFWSALDTLIQAGHRTFVEIGPHPVLAVAISQCLAYRSAEGHVLPSIRRDADEQGTMLGTLGRLYVLGHSIEWKGLYSEGQCLPLPPYGWQMRRFWTDANPMRSEVDRKRAPDDPGRPYGQLTRLRSPLIRDVVFEWCPDIEALPLLAEHRFFGGTVLPAPVYIEIVLAAAGEAFGPEFGVLADLSIHRSLILQADALKSVQVILKRSDDTTVSFEVSSLALNGDPEEPWVLLASGTVSEKSHGLTPSLPEGLREGIPEGRCEPVAGERFYRDLEQRGIFLGSRSRCIEAYWPNGEEVIARLHLPKTVPAKISGGRIHPILVDACLQSAAILDGGGSGDGVYVVVGLGRFRQHGSAANTLLCHARLRSAPAARVDSYCADVTLFGMQGELVAEVEGVCLKRADAEILLREATSQVEAEILEVTWLERELTKAEPSNDSAGGDWLIFADRSGISDALVSLVGELGGGYRLIEAERTYSNTDGYLTIDPACAEHYQRIVQELIVLKRSRWRAIVYLWGVDVETNRDSKSPSEAALSASVNLLHLIRALTGKINGGCPPIWIVTRGAMALDQNEAPRLEQSPLWGFGRVILTEHPELWGGLVDLDPGATPQAAAHDLLMEISRADEERQVLLRRNRRFVPVLEPVKIEAAPPPSMDPQAAYLIAGGLGGIGLETAGWMVRQGARRLILTARTPIPDRSGWDRIGVDHDHFGRIAAIRAMEAMGAEVKTAALDMADETQVRNLLETLRHEGWMPIRGVIHAAAVVRDVLLSQMGPDELRAVFRPKVEGGWLIHRMFEDQPLDFMVFFSSMGALLGQTGQGSYAAANVFLDALAHYRCQKGQPAQSINWGSWIGSGLAVTPGGIRAIRTLSLQGIEGITAQKATEAFGKLLNAGYPQTVVTGIDWKQFRGRNLLGADLTISSLARSSVAAFSVHASQRASEKVGGIRQALGSVEQGPQRRELLEGEIARMLAAVLKMEAAEIDPEKPFGSLGLDSLTALELKNRCESGMGLTLSATMAWNHPSLRALATHLADKMGIALDEILTSGGGLAPDILEPDRPVEKADDGCILASVGKLSDEEALRQLLGKA